MKQKLQSFKALLMVLMVSLFAGNAWADTYTIKFKTNTTEGSTSVTSTTKVSDVISDGSDYVSGFTSNCSKVFYPGISGVKLGATRNAGVFEFTLADNYQANIKKITVKSVAYGSDTGTLTLSDNSGDLKTGITPGTDYTHTYDAATTVSSIKLATSAKRAYISEIIIETDNSGKVSATVPTLTEAGIFTTATYDVTITNNESGAKVYYTTDGSDPDATKLTSTYFEGDSKTLTISATTTVKAMAVVDGKDNSSVASATYTYEKSIANTAETAYTTAEAITLIDAGSTQLTTTEVYVKGTVSKVDSYSSQYGSLTYWLDDNTFEVYSGLGLEGAKFTATTDLQTGDEVVVKGIIKKYGTTYEFDKNNVLISRKTSSTKTSPTFTLGTYQTKLTVGGADDEYTVTTNSDGEVTVTSSDENVAEAIVVDGTVLVSAKAAGTTTITVAVAETDTYYAASKTYTLTVIAPATIPFKFDGAKADVATTAGMSQSGLGSDYKSSPYLKFDTTDDNLVIAFGSEAKYLGFAIKGNGSPWSGTFDVLESADGVNYTSLASYTGLAQATTYMTLEPNSDSRYVKFVYTERGTNSNVALGAIYLGDKESANMYINGDLGCATFCAPFDVDLTDYAEFYNIKAYKATLADEGSWVRLNEIENHIVPAGTPVVLYGDEIKDEVISGVPAVFSETCTWGCLTGNLGNTATIEQETGVTKYILQNQETTGTGWYEVKSDDIKIGANRCYMSIASTGARAFYPMAFEETTGIRSIATEAQTKADGKYLVNGKIVVVKAGKAYNMNGQVVK